MYADYASFAAMYKDVLTWYPPCMEADNTTGLASVAAMFAQVADNHEWPWTDVCFADTHSAQGIFDQIAVGTEGVDASGFEHFYWAVQTGDFSYFPADGGEDDDQE